MRIQALIGVASVSMLALAGPAAGQTATGHPGATAAAELPAHDREGVIQAVVERWRPVMDAQPHARGWDREIARFLRAASDEKLRAASQASSYEGVVAALHAAWKAPDVTPLAPGESPAPLIGQAADELVFYPVTPCRIIDTRVATPPGPIAPATGRQFSVNLSNYTAQGGFNGSCGMPLTFDPAAVAINVTSVNQSGPGFLAVAPTGAGTPSASLVNYVAGAPIANAAVVRQAMGQGDDILVFSGVGSTHVVVDVMGYFAAPTATPPDNNVLVTSQAVTSNSNFSIWSPPCPAGWRLTGGGHVSAFFSPTVVIGGRPVQGTTFPIVTGVNAADRWLCQGTNGPDSQQYHCFSVCARAPGR